MRLIDRLFRRAPSPAHCIRRATGAHVVVGSGPRRPASAPVPDTVPDLRPKVADLAPRPIYRDPFAGVVTGPLLVERTRWIQAWHHRRYGDDDGFPHIEWGTFLEGEI